MAWGLVSMTLRGLLSVVILLWTVTFTDGRDIDVTCVFSEDCVLPCSFQPGSEEVIHWLQPEDKDLTVHSYYYSTDQLKQQSQPYRGRTALFNDQIPKGNASLLLRGITLQDQGRYKCYTSTIKGNKESCVNIAVEAPVRLVDIQLSDDIITCSSTGIYPEPKLTWSTDPPSDLSFDPGTIQNSTSIKVDDRGLYDITSTKQFSRDRTNICTVTSGTVERTATLKQQDPVQGSPSSEVSILCSVSQSDLLTFDLTWRFKQTDTILTSSYTNGTPQMQVDDQWKEQVQSLSDSGSLQLHKLTMVHQGTYSCELSTARDTHLILTYLQITPDKLSDVSDGLSPGSITGIAAAIIAAAIIAAAVICFRLRANTNGPNENGQSGIPLQNGEEREEDIERRQEQGQGEDGSATSTILMPQTEGDNID
ncbi:V-set domain-containing T-cell activation inhibitor 1 isoform X1 [Salmo salar]|uniref:V-set domain-containing T-cell activation inhibitor 1 isoform X1 n=1 Tax=Salmo salar TaxID=8030 RepID=A0ABM3E651_SALSA|nr:V-set domain-containing T-cell activation inhibitor 1-like isoform X1 [Salmo salar]